MKKFVCLILLVLALSLLAAHAEEFGIGEPWNVDGQWTLTIDSIEETRDRNQFSDKKPAAVYIITYTYSNIGYVDSNGIMDGLYLPIDNRIVDSDGMMGYSYPASYEYYPQEVPVGAKCKAQAAIGVDTAGLPIKLYVDQYDGNGTQQSAVFVLDAQSRKSKQTTKSNNTQKAAIEELSLSDIIPDDSVWGLSTKAFKSAYAGSYSSTKVGKSSALVKENLSVEGYEMSAYYVFSNGKLSKITYVLLDDSDKTSVKACAANLIDTMSDVLGTVPTEGKGVSEWNGGSIQIGTAKLKNYTGSNNLNACVIFREGASAQATATKVTENSTIATVREWVDQGLGIGETVSNLLLENRTLSMSINLGSGGILPLEDLAESRVSSITDEILNHTEFDSEWDKIVISFTDVRDYIFTKDDIISSSYGRYFDPTGLETPGNTSSELPTQGKEYKIKHGEFLSSTVNGNTIVIKAKITPNLTNSLTIKQNYLNVDDLIRNQGLDEFNEIQYWAVADMTDGSESKVISFTVPKNIISAIANANISASDLGDYVDDLWILPSLRG